MLSIPDMASQSAVKPFALRGNVNCNFLAKLTKLMHLALATLDPPVVSHQSEALQDSLSSFAAPDLVRHSMFATGGHLGGNPSLRAHESRRP